jgi:cytochrome c1
MMVALLILAIMHPGRFLQGPNSSLPRLSRAEKKAKKEAKKADKAAKKDAKAARKGRKTAQDYDYSSSSSENVEHAGGFGGAPRFTGSYEMNDHRGR